MTTKYSRETVPMMGVKYREASAKSQVQNENVILQNGEDEDSSRRRIRVKAQEWESAVCVSHAVTGQFGLV